MRLQPPPAQPALRRMAGFTLMELVMVMVIIGALATFALPRVLDLTEWRLRAFGDELRSQMQAAQRLSLQQRRVVVATLTGAGLSLAYGDGSPITTLACPAAATPCIAETSARTVTFNAANSGAVTTSSGAALPVTVSSGSTTRRFQVEAETGLFHSLP